MKHLGNTLVSKCGIKIVHVENILQCFYREQQGYVSVKLPDVPSAQVNHYQGIRLKVWIYIL